MDYCAERVEPLGQPLGILVVLPDLFDKFFDLQSESEDCDDACCAEELVYLRFL